MTFIDNNQLQNRPSVDPNPLPGRIDPGPGRPDAPLPISQPRRSLYSPRSPIVDASGWGSTDGDWAINAAASSPRGSTDLNMPSPPEAYSYAASSTGQLSRWSAPDVAAPAARANQAAMSFAPLLDLLSRGAFSASFNASSLASIKRRQQQMLLDIEETRQAHEKLMLEAAGIYNAYDSIDAKTGAHGIDQQEAEARLLDFARMHNWGALEQLIGTHGLEAARQFLKKEHATYLDMVASQTTLKKATGADEDAEIAKEWGLDPSDITRGGSGVTGGGGSGSFFAGGPSAPVPAGEIGAAPRRADFSSEFDSDYAKRMHLSPQQMRAIQEEVDTGKSPASIAMLEKQKGGQAKDMALGRQGQGVTDINSQIDKLANDSNLSYDDKMRQIEQINPGVANHLKGLIGLDLDPKETAVPNRGIMARRAEAISKSKGSPEPFSQDLYRAKSQFFDPNKPETRLVVRSGTMAEAALNVWGALNLTSETDSNLSRMAEAYMAGTITGADYRYKQIFDALADYANHFYGVESGTGTPRVGPMREWLKEIGAYSSPWQIRAAIAQNLSASFGFVDTYQTQWEKFKPNTLMPYIDARHYAILRSLLRGNTETGELPSDSPREALAVSRNPSEARKNADKSPPLTMDQIRKDVIPQIAIDSVSPDPAKRQRAQDARRRIGHVIGIEHYVPEVDSPDAFKR